ncbi:MAG: succinate dehydrogenase, hydrophobic membrane anchor protein [Alphaproteobacteria bacterium]|nr:succinate dehydrogenase, hydrophobic membrane anchor protein [Alphaproteobacteria bacterium]
MSARTPIARVRGLGSAKGGTHHWWMQRVTALALAPLTVWFVASLIRLVGADHAAVADWLASPLTTVLMLLLIVATFHHLQLGLQVVIEDYIHGEAAKIGCIIGVKFASFALAVAAGVAVLKVAF